MLMMLAIKDMSCVQYGCFTKAMLCLPGYIVAIAVTMVPGNCTSSHSVYHHIGILSYYGNPSGCLSR